MKFAWTLWLVEDYYRISSSSSSSVYWTLMSFSFCLSFSFLLWPNNLSLFHLLLIWQSQFVLFSNTFNRVVIYLLVILSRCLVVFLICLFVWLDKQILITEIHVLVMSRLKRSVPGLILMLLLHLILLLHLHQ